MPDYVLSISTFKSQFSCLFSSYRPRKFSISCLSVETKSRQFGACKLALGILEHVDILGDALRGRVIPNHLTQSSPKGD